jgi:hypothetical protein
LSHRPPLTVAGKPFSLKLDAHWHVSSMTWVKRARILGLSMVAPQRRTCRARC